MLEVLRQRFKPKETLPERGKRELTSEVYLASLSEQDRKSVLQFVDFAKTLKDRCPDTRFGVIAVGSTTRPEDKRDHPIDDIDLRILNSQTPGTPLYTETVENLIDAIRSYLTEKGIEYSYDRHTVEELLGGSGYLDWYNTNPSFTTKSEEGHPLHISISGSDALDLDRHIFEERRDGGSFCILMEDK